MELPVEPLSHSLVIPSPLPPSSTRCEQPTQISQAIEALLNFFGSRVLRSEQRVAGWLVCIRELRQTSKTNP